MKPGSSTYGSNGSWGRETHPERTASSARFGVLPRDHSQGPEEAPGQAAEEEKRSPDSDPVLTSYQVERQSRFTPLVTVRNKETATVVATLARQMRILPKALRRSLTWDRGLELAQHAAFTVATDVQVYFCDPQSPWQRGTNENTNRFLRQYPPKRTNLTVHSQAALNRIARRLDERPRKTLGYETPAAKLAAALR